MTRIMLAVALTVTPSPITAPKEVSWTPNPTIDAPTVVSAVADSTWFAVDTTEPLFIAIDVGTALSEPLTAESPPPEPPPPMLTPIEAGMNRLSELGATPYQLRVFGCLAWYESRNNPYAVSATNDHGLWQINRFYHAWRWRGRDVYDPIVNAEVAWDIYRESGFRAWTTARLCGV